MNIYYEPVNLKQWNMFKEVKGIGHVEPFLATKEMEIGDIVLLHVGSQSKLYPSGIYAYGTIVHGPYILKDRPLDYCNNKNSVDVRIDYISENYIVDHKKATDFITQFRTPHKIKEEFYDDIIFLLGIGKKEVANLWDSIEKEHIYEAIRIYESEKPECKGKPDQYYIKYKGKEYPSKKIRRMSYVIAYGVSPDENSFFGGEDTIKFFGKEKFNNEFEIVYYENGKKKKEIDEGKSLSEKSIEELKAMALQSTNAVEKHGTSIYKGYKRSDIIKQYTKKIAKGVCQLCNAKAPFVDKTGEPYLESHHIIWLSRGGEDSINNTTALCPNCHRKMHIIDDKTDIEFLLKKSAEMNQ